MCHGLRRVVEFDGHEPWKEVVAEMIGKGANLSTAGSETVVDYLEKTYPAH